VTLTFELDVKNLTAYRPCNIHPAHKVPSKSHENFLSNLVSRHTDRQSNSGKNITPSNFIGGGN